MTEPANTEPAYTDPTDPQPNDPANPAEQPANPAEQPGEQPADPDQPANPGEPDPAGIDPGNSGPLDETGTERLGTERLGTERADTGAGVPVDAGGPDAAGDTVEPLLRYFGTDHLPPNLAQVSSKFATLAEDVVRFLPRSPERTVCLRHLLDAKDAGVRAVL